MNKSIIVIAICAAAVVGLTALAIDRATPVYEFVQESEFPIASAVPSMKGYGSLADLQEDTVLIAEIFIKDQHTELTDYTKTPATWSDAEIKQVISGDSNVKSVKIGEVGGLVEGKEYMIANVPVMKKGNTYIVFLGEGVYENTYEIVGGIYGKIRINDQTNKGVVTIDREAFYEHMDDLYWFQKKFAGKDKEEIVMELKGI